jgi:DNA-binding LacI/PurR family transcriptional regulator
LLIKNFFLKKVFGLLFGLIFLQQKMDQEGVQNLNGVLFLFVMENSFNNVFVNAQILPEEFPLVFLENKAGMYRVYNYLISKIVVDVIYYLLSQNTIYKQYNKISILLTFQRYLVM